MATLGEESIKKMIEKTLIIRCILGHQGIPGNEAAHQAARVLLCFLIPDPGAEHPSHDDEDNEDLDCTEAATIAGMGRRAVL